MLRQLTFIRTMKLVALVFLVASLTEWALPCRAQKQLPSDMPAEDRSLAKAEQPRNQAYCEHQEILSVVLDCACFSRTVLQYRGAHFKDNKTQPGPTGWESLPSLLNGEKLNCNQCLSSSGLSKWIAEQTHTRLLLRTAKNPSQLTTSLEKKISECVAKSVTESFREKPFVGLLTDQLNEAFFQCQKWYLP